MFISSLISLIAIEHDYSYMYVTLYMYIWKCMHLFLYFRKNICQDMMRKILIFYLFWIVFLSYK